MIRLNDVSKAFGALKAVDRLGFVVERGETFGFLGPNGAGKSTCVAMMAGILRPDSGTVEIAGGGSPSDPGVRRAIGVAPQALAFYEELSARENLAFFAALYGITGAPQRERVEYALDFVGLADRAGDRAGTFSGGMKRRLNLACALVHDPQILILDEPTVGVDPQSRNAIFERIERLQAAGMTIIYTTHYMEEVQRLCRRVAIIDHGRLLALDTVEGLVAAHGGESLVEAEFSGEAPAFDGAIREGRRLTLRTERPFEAVARLALCGAPMEGLRVTRATLEDVFLNLTGRRLRD